MEKEKTVTDPSSQYLPLVEIEEHGKLLKTVGYKSLIAGITAICIGIVIALAPEWKYHIFGGLFALAGLAYLLFVKDTILIRLYDDALIFLDSERPYGIRVAYDEILEWNTRSNSVNVTRNDGLTLHVETPIAYRAMPILRKYCKDKETGRITEDDKIDFGKFFKK